MSRGGGGREGRGATDDWPLDCKVYVGGLPGDGDDAASDEVGIKNELEDVFSRYGRLKKVWVARRPPGFAFLEFEDPRDATDACRALDGTRMCGVRARVEMSSGRRRNRGGGGGGYGDRDSNGYGGGRGSYGGGRDDYRRDDRRDSGRDSYRSDDYRGGGDRDRGGYRERRRTPSPARGRPRSRSRSPPPRRSRTRSPPPSPKRESRSRSRSRS